MFQNIFLVKITSVLLRLDEMDNYWNHKPCGNGDRINQHLSGNICTKKVITTKKLWLYSFILV